MGPADTSENSAPDTDQITAIKALRVNIDKVIQEAKTHESSRAFSLVITKLEEAKMWAGKRFEELGRELPKEYQDKAD